MVMLQSPRGECVRVPCRCLIGRSAIADLRLYSRKASSEHAALGWYEQRWTLRDLASSNGTSIDGRQLGHRQRAYVATGNQLRFGGDDEIWTVLDTDEPEPCAVQLGAQEYRFGQDRLLLLPLPEAPEASLYLEKDRWRLDAGHELAWPESGDILHLASGYWRVHLPDYDAASTYTAGHELDLTQLELHFDVSPERALVTLKQGGRQVQLPARASVYTLLLLARARLQESQREPEAGWVSCAQLAEQRSCSEEKVNIDIHRLRDLFREAGVHRAASIIERNDSKHVRIGVRRLNITDARPVKRRESP